MSARPRRLAGISTRLPVPQQVQQERAVYARFGSNDPLVNSPEGYPSAYPPITWLGGGGDGPTDWWYGIDSGGLSVPIGPHGPWAGQSGDLSVITRATALITGPLTAAPFRVVSEGQVGMPLPSPAWVRDPMNLRPDNRGIGSIYPSVLRLSRSAFWSSFVRNALWFGLGAFIFIPDVTGAPSAGSLRLIDPRFLTTERDEAGALCWSIDDGSGSAAVFDRDGSISFGSITYKVNVLRNPLSPVDGEGMSMGVFAMNPSTFKIGSQIQAFMSGTFRAGVPAGYLKLDQPVVTQEQSDELRSRWLAHHGGDQRSIAVLNAATSFTPIQYSPVDAAVGEVTRLSVAATAFAFNIDPLMFTVTLGNSATYATTAAAFAQHKDYSLSVWISALQDVLSALLPGSQGVVVNLDQFANPSFKERVDTGKTAVEAGLMLVDEWRALEGLPPLPTEEEPPEPEPVVTAPPPAPAPVEDERSHRQHLAWRS